jgi:hypothetical protein
MGRIRLRGGETVHVPTHPSQLVTRLPHFAEMRANLQRRTGHDLRVIDAYLDRRLTQVVEHIGDIYLREIEAHIDNISRLRERLSHGIESVVRKDGRLEGMSIAEFQRSFRELDAVLNDLQSTQRYIQEMSEQRTREIFQGSRERSPSTADPIKSVAASHIPPNTPSILAASLKSAETQKQLSLKAQSITYHVSGEVTVKFKRQEVKISVQDGLYHATVADRSSGNIVTQFKEFDIVPRHGTKPLSTNVLQSHHGLQDALMLDVFSEYGYRKEHPPAIWLRNSLPGSPHRVISDIQKHTLSSRKSASPSYAQIRQWGIADLKAANAPENSIRAYMARMDKYFEANVLPKIPANEVPKLVGTYQSLAGEAP